MQVSTFLQQHPELSTSQVDTIRSVLYKEVEDDEEDIELVFKRLKEKNLEIKDVDSCLAPFMGDSFSLLSKKNQICTKRKI